MLLLNAAWAPISPQRINSRPANPPPAACAGLGDCAGGAGACLPAAGRPLHHRPRAGGPVHLVPGKLCCKFRCGFECLQCGIRSGRTCAPCSRPVSWLHGNQSCACAEACVGRTRFRVHWSFSPSLPGGAFLSCCSLQHRHLLLLPPPPHMPQVWAMKRYTQAVPFASIAVSDTAVSGLCASGVGHEELH